MDQRTRERVERWDAEPLTDGLDEVRSRTDTEFSGVIAANETWLFVLNGRVVGVFGGAIADVADATGQVYEAPDPALPLLLSMLEEGGETQATYYTEETDLLSVDETLQDASFTGYVELSEDVLSGDYYLVYYGGRRMAAAYIGNAERLLTGEEAVERAADEVGIYEVVSVDVTVTDVPDGDATTTSVEAETQEEVAEVDSTGEPAEEPATVPSQTLGEQSTATQTAESGSVESPQETAPTAAEADADAGDAGQFEEEERWREQRSIPSIEPDEREDVGTVEDAFDEAVLEREDRIDELRQQLEKLDVRREALEEELERVTAERDELAARNEKLETRVSELEGRLEDTEPAEETAARSLSPERALAGTNVFVRYESKSDPTLTAVADGAERSAVTENLRLEYHTEFDASETAVDGAPYREFLGGTLAYRFVDWLTGTAPFEIRDTGAESGLADLYEAIPRIDRVAFDGTVTVEHEEGDPQEYGFDLVAFDKMGHPLVVASLNDSRDPAGQGHLEDLEAAASAVRAEHDELAAAVAVTSSFFEPGALSVAEEATSGGFLSRNSRLSFVKISRKSGYHLCLAESRQGGFHLAVPEL